MTYSCELSSGISKEKEGITSSIDLYIVLPSCGRALHAFSEEKTWATRRQGYAPQEARRSLLWDNHMQPRHQKQLYPNSSSQSHIAVFTPGPDLPGHWCEHSDIEHVLRIDGGPRIQFTKGEYRLLMLILERAQDDYVSYTDIARAVYQRELDGGLLLLLRKRVSDIRRKIADYDIDIMNVPYRGYKASTFHGLSIPYRRGYRARKMQGGHNQEG